MLLAFARILALSFTLPKIGTSSYLFLFRILFAVVVTLAIGPLLITGELIDPISNADLVSLLFSEIGIGLSLGLAASCVVIGLQSAGQIVSQLLGFQVGSLQQGLNAEQSTDYRKLFFVVALFFWFGVSGHRIMLEGMLRSFQYFEVGQFHFSMEIVQLFNQMIGLCLEFSIRFSLPIVCVGILGFLVTGFSSKIFASQTTSVAFTVNQLLFFLILVPLTVLYSEEIYRQTVNQVETMLTALTDLKLNAGVH